MKNKESYYAIIPANVRYCSKLTPNAKLLYGEITALCNKKGYCWATNNHFAKLYNVSKTSISKWISDLEENGFIKCRIKNNNMRRIYIKEPYKKSYKSLQEKLKGPTRKVKGLYNTKRNNKRKLRRLDEDDGMCVSSLPLFEGINIKSFEGVCTIKLYKLIKSKRKVNRTPTMLQWINHFHELRKGGIKKKRIIKVLDWYIKHFGEEYIPEALTAGGFRNKFFRIETAMDKSVERTKKKEGRQSRTRIVRTVVMPDDCIGREDD